MCSEHRTSGAAGSPPLTHCGDAGEPWQAQLQRGHGTMPLL